jgi:hypothetical protein
MHKTRLVRHSRAGGNPEQIESLYPGLPGTQLQEGCSRNAPNFILELSAGPGNGGEGHPKVTSLINPALLGALSQKIFQICRRQS